MNKIGDLSRFTMTKKSKFQGGGLMQVFTPPDPNDLTTSTQKYFTGAIEHMASVMYDKCRVNNLR